MLSDANPTDGFFAASGKTVLERTFFLATFMGCEYL